MGLESRGGLRNHDEKSRYDEKGVEDIEASEGIERLTFERGKSRGKTIGKPARFDAFATFDAFSAFDAFAWFR